MVLFRVLVSSAAGSLLEAVSRAQPRLACPQIHQALHLLDQLCAATFVCLCARGCLLFLMSLAWHVYHGHEPCWQFKVWGLKRNQVTAATTVLRKSRIHDRCAWCCSEGGNCTLRSRGLVSFGAVILVNGTFLATRSAIQDEDEGV